MSPSYNNPQWRSRNYGRNGHSGTNNRQQQAQKLPIMTVWREKILGKGVICANPSLCYAKFVDPQSDNNKGVELLIDSFKKSANEIHKDFKPFIPKGTVSLKMKLKSRLLLNMATGLLENAGICLDRNSGRPYIPGSAVKGAARHYAWELLKSKTDPTEKTELIEKINLTFGFSGNCSDKTANSCEGFAGTICFMDAFPLHSVMIEKDIVCPHHSKYMSGDKQKVTDDEMPVPIIFPAIKAGAVFDFKLIPLSCRNEANLEFAKECLINALMINGIGAKTTSGYGLFEKDLESEKQEIFQKKDEILREEKQNREKIFQQMPDRQKELVNQLKDAKFSQLRDNLIIFQNENDLNYREALKFALPDLMKGIGSDGKVKNADKGNLILCNEKLVKCIGRMICEPNWKDKYKK